MKSLRDTLLEIAKNWNVDVVRMLAPWNLTGQRRKDLHMKCRALRDLSETEATSLEVETPAVVLTVGTNARAYLVYMGKVDVSGTPTKTPLCVDYDEQGERVQGTQHLDAPRQGFDGRGYEGDSEGQGWNR